MPRAGVSGRPEVAVPALPGGEARRAVQRARRQRADAVEVLAVQGIALAQPALLQERERGRRAGTPGGTPRSSAASALRRGARSPGWRRPG